MLGDLSASYESNGDPGCISTGWNDPGGKSYGSYQLASNMGSVQEYIDWLCANEYWFGPELNKYYVGSAQFDAAWKWLAEGGNREDFARSQHDYIKYAYYDRAVRYLANVGFHIENHAEVMKDVVWSRAVQYGPGNIVEMFTDACKALGQPNLSYVDAPSFDAAIIKAVYLEVCSSWEWNSSALRDSLNERFQDECNVALSRL